MKLSGCGCSHLSGTSWPFSRAALLFAAAVLCGVVATAPGAWPAEEAQAAESAPQDKVLLRSGESVEGTLLDETDRKVTILVGKDKKSFPRNEVSKVERGASPKLLEFFEKKFKQFKESGSAKSWKALASFCKKKGLIAERRRTLREILQLEPSNAAARAELGHAMLEGRWLDEDEVAAKLKEGYTLKDGKLVKHLAVTAVKKEEPKPPHYHMLPREKLSRSRRETLEKERRKRLKDAEAFLKQKEREYLGVAWEERYKVKTPHFEVQCNSTREVTRAYAALMEIIRAKLSTMFPSRNVRGNLRAPVFIYSCQDEFIQQDGFARWGGRGLGGYYNPISQAITTYHGTFGFTGTTFGVLCHEGTHYYQGLVLKKFDNVPIWLIEGFAVYFGDGSIFDVKKRKISVGNIPRDRLATVQEKMLVGRHDPVEKLVAMTRRNFTGSDYADAWALIYFLVQSGEDGKNLLKNYWNIGLYRQIKTGKREDDFRTLAEKYFGSVEELEKRYVKYILQLDMPAAGKVVGDYFVSDTFQFDFKAPGDEWEFFEDKEDKKLLVGLLRKGSTAEIRIYYENNIENAKSEQFFKGYLRMAEARYKEVKHEKVKIANMDGYKVAYIEEEREEIPQLTDIGELLRFRNQPGSLGVKKKKSPYKGSRNVVKYLLIQVDGVVSIECSCGVKEFAEFADVFDSVNKNLTLTLTRRW